jgi:hypothetical protein
MIEILCRKAVMMLMDSLLVALIGFGLAYTLAKLDGPLGVAALIRRLLQRPALPGWVRNGADCVFCWSFYATLLAAWLVAPGPDGFATLTTSFVATWLAGFGLACFLFLYTGH